MLDPLQARRKEEFLNPHPLPDRGNVQLYLKTDLGDIIGRYPILSIQIVGGLARLPVGHPLGARDGGLTGGCFGNSSILGGHSSKADSYHFHRMVS